MRLIEVDTYRLCERPEPPTAAESNYGILSHTWGDDEVLFHDMHPRADMDKLQPLQGFVETKYTNRQTKEDGLSYFWIDTCCIN
jgi:hypothetical protein